MNLRRVGRGLSSKALAAVLCFLLCCHCYAIRTCGQTEVYRSVKTDSMKIALTFDDGPHPRLTQEILEVLDQYQIRATFFMVGCNVYNYPDAARAVIRAGHEVGNHTFSHRHFQHLSESIIREEIERCEDALEELCEYRPHLFRPPQGVLTPYVENCSADGDYALILWSLDTRDWETKDAKTITRCILEQIQPGDIILMHDYIGRGSQTPEALRSILPILLERGFEFVTVSELLEG